MPASPADESEPSDVMAEAAGPAPSVVVALSTEVKRLGRASGLDAIGLTTAAPFASAAVEIQRRKRVGTSGRLRFTFGDPRSTDVTRTFPAARSLVVGARSYVPEIGEPPSRPLAGHIARFAVGDAYEPLRQALARIAELLLARGYQAEVLVDDNRLVDRAAAVRAGVAWWGKSTMAIAPKFGPWLLFGSVVTDARLVPDEPMARDCGTCSACIPACPTGALDHVGTLDATRCIAYWLQTPGIIPSELRTAIGSRIYGCDECLVSCPPGQRISAEERPSLDAAVDLATLLIASDEELLTRHGHFYIPRRNPAYLRRNALVALANVGDRSHFRLIEPYLDHRLADVRAHAVAAIVALGGNATEPPLAARFTQESHPGVIAEYGAGVS